MAAACLSLNLWAWGRVSDPTSCILQSNSVSAHVTVFKIDSSEVYGFHVSAKWASLPATKFSAVACKHCSSTMKSLTSSSSVGSCCSFGAHCRKAGRGVVLGSETLPSCSGSISPNFGLKLAFPAKWLVWRAMTVAPWVASLPSSAHAFANLFLFFYVFQCPCKIVTENKFGHFNWLITELGNNWWLHQFASYKGNFPERMPDHCDRIRQVGYEARPRGLDFVRCASDGRGGFDKCTVGVLRRELLLSLLFVEFLPEAIVHLWYHHFWAISRLLWSSTLLSEHRPPTFPP